MKYIVRTNSYNYNDENYYIESSGDVIGVFTDRQQAIAACNKANVTMLGEFDNLNDFIFSSGNEERKYNWLRNFYQQNFSIELDNSEPDFIEGEVPVPEAATDAQLLEIINNLDIRFCQVFEFDDTPQMVELKYNPQFWGKQQYDPLIGESGRSFYFSEKEALEYSQEGLSAAFYEVVPGLKGHLAQLSNAPEILNSFLERSKALTYDEQNLCIKLREGVYGVEADELNALIDLLIVKPYTVEVYNLEDTLKLAGKQNEDFAKTQKEYKRNNPEEQQPKKWWQFWK